MFDDTHKTKLMKLFKDSNAVNYLKTSLSKIELGKVKDYKVSKKIRKSELIEVYERRCEMVRDKIKIIYWGIQELVEGLRNEKEEYISLHSFYFSGSDFTVFTNFGISKIVGIIEIDCDALKNEKENK